MENIELFPQIEEHKEDFGVFNQEVLMTILAQNSDTEIGRKYCFGDIKSAEDYASRLPLSVYDDYSALIERERKGEKNVLTVYDNQAYLATSGSTGIQKIFPLTKRSLDKWGDMMDRYMKKKSENRLLISFLQEPTGIESTQLMMSTYIHHLYKEGILPMENILGGEKLFFFDTPCDYFYAKLWIAFTSKRITSLESIFLYDFLLFFKYMEDNAEKVLDDMSKRHVSDDIDLSLERKKSLESMEIDPERIEEIRRECAKGYDLIVKRLWPDVKFVSGIGSRAFQTEEITSKRYLGDIPVWHYLYGASECLMAIPCRLNSYDYIFCPGHAYYEFLEAETGRLCDVQSLKLDTYYEPVITTWSGLYRYKIGDILKHKGYYGNIPIFQFMRRKNQMLNIAGEKMGMDMLENAVLSWAKSQGVELWQYFFYEDYESVPACYHGVIATLQEKKMDTKCLDEWLGKSSKDYSELRELHSIAEVKVDIVNRDCFMSILKDHSTGKGHQKPHHIIMSKTK